jgi:hypothetical protein
MDFKDMLNQNRGYDAFAEKEKEAEERQKNFVNRFWLPADSSTRIVFLDDNPPIIEEHQLQIDGDWRNWVTCLRMVGDSCPVCDNLDSKAYTVGFYTVLDMSEWKDKQGKTHKNEMKLFPAKFKTLQVLKRLSAKRGSLEGCVFDVSRSTSDAPNTGDVFDFETKITKEEILALNPEAKPFNYAEILEPRAAGDIMALLKKASRKSAGKSSDSERIDW